MKKKFFPSGALSGLLFGGLLAALLLLPSAAIWLPLDGAGLRGAILRAPHWFAALFSLPPLLCALPLLRALPRALRESTGRRRAACWSSPGRCSWHPSILGGGRPRTPS